ncbi:AIM24 family protein [Lentisphaera marina]|uniref:AIM24 family protein n=1 Tax=Lentisphaera marina TaxID=1111041 RepID=UPI00236702A5|nr:AIM24 family protein [Lentisphaera marina]MDD7983683.1 AIM24 family protein [Lentisphaera marina]
MKLAFDIAKFITSKVFKLLLIVVLILAAIQLKKRVQQWYEERAKVESDIVLLNDSLSQFKQKQLDVLELMKANKLKIQEQIDLQESLKKSILQHKENEPLFFLIEDRLKWEAELKILETSLSSSEKLQQNFFSIARQGRKTQAQLKLERDQKMRLLDQKKEELIQYNWYEKHVKKISSTIILIALLVLLAPLINRLFWYSLPGAWVEKRPPYLLDPDGISSEISFSCDSSKQLKIQLNEAEKICVKQNCYNSFDEDLERKNRFLWDPKAWLISYSAEMINMTDFHNPNPQEAQITLVAPKAEDDLCKISLNECHGLILKPGQIIAVKGDVHLSTQWNFFSIHNWLRLVFRHIIFSGTGDIYLYLHGGGDQIKGESLRIKEDHLVGYQTSCPVGLVRNENLWHYLLGKCNLFDYRFKSDKFILMQNQSSPTDNNKTPGERFFDAILGTVGKFLGF